MPLLGVVALVCRYSQSVRSASALRLVEQAIIAPKHEIHENLSMSSYSKSFGAPTQVFFK